MNRDFSLLFNQVQLNDLGPYICHAYSGKGKPVSIYVTLKAYGPAHTTNPDDEPYLKYVVRPDEIAPQPSIPRYPYRPVVRPPVEIPVEVPLVVVQNIPPQTLGKYF